MREIKFRAFDKETEDNHMVYSDGRDYKSRSAVYDFVVNKNGEVVCVWEEDYDDSCGFSQTNSGTLDNLMQFTGLHDKNGKEIYEGDIGIHQTSHRCIVEFIGGAFRIGEYHTLLNRIENFEVVGNIYENPELLEAKQ